MIGVFDSGIGGLTVVRAIMALLPGYDVVYFGDTARTPYGSKSPATVLNYAVQNTEFLLGQKAQVIVMACNTASSVATAAITERYPVPLFEVITPAVEQALTHTSKGRIGVIGTRATINSGIYEQKIKALRPEAQVHSRACPLLVPLVEEGWLTRPETAMIVKKYLHPLKVRQIDTLILGCTHYPLLARLIQHKVGRRVTLIDSALAVAERLKAFVSQQPRLKEKLGRNEHYTYFVSDLTEQFRTTARQVLKRPVDLERILL
jgi:glutamate racemase